MRLVNLSLRQFRNHNSLDLAVDPGVNLFIGGNGAGKTNLVEAIAVLATGMSPRGGDSETMVQWGTSGFFVKGFFEFENEKRDPFTLEMTYKRGSSRVIRENGQNVVRLKNLLGRVPLVSFVPEDLSLVKGEPELRRQAINMILAQVDPSYRANLQTYNESLKSRNAALRQIADGAMTLEALLPWDQALIHSGIPLIKKREEFICEYAPRVNAIHQRITGAQETVGIEYQPSIGLTDENAAEKWIQHCEKQRNREIAAGVTLSGPQRDEFLFLINNRSARAFGSEGQKRTAAVSFKLAEIPFIEEKTGQRPVCLLDDVLSELDANRAGHLLDELSRTGQCFVTLTGLENWPRKKGLPAAIYHVDEDGVRAASHTAELIEA